MSSCLGSNGKRHRVQLNAKHFGMMIRQLPDPVETLTLYLPVVQHIHQNMANIPDNQTKCKLQECYLNCHLTKWRLGAVVSVVGRINEVNQHRARLIHDG